MGSVLVIAGQARIARDIGIENCGKFARETIVHLIGIKI
jgi:hypothetical protein